jgi:hypothetical protein
MSAHYQLSETTPNIEEAYFSMSNIIFPSPSLKLGKKSGTTNI